MHERDQRARAQADVHRLRRFLQPHDGGPEWAEHRSGNGQSRVSREVGDLPIGVALGRLSLQRHQPQLQTERPRIECAGLIACQQTDADEAHEMRKRLGGRHARRSRETRHGANGDLGIANSFAVDKALGPGLTWLPVVGEVAAVVRHAGQA